MEVEIEIPFKFGKIRIRGEDIASVIEKLNKINFQEIEEILKKKQGIAIETIAKKPEENPILNFTKKARPISYYDKIMVCVYFLATFTGAKIINQNDLKNTFVEASFPMPRNLGDMMNKLVGKGLVAESAEKKEGLKSWYITQEGISYVERGFKKDKDG